MKTTNITQHLIEHELALLKYNLIRLQSSLRPYNTPTKLYRRLSRYTAKVSKQTDLTHQALRFGCLVPLKFITETLFEVV